MLVRADERWCALISRPGDMGGFHFAVLSTLRATQLIHGCRPRVDGGHKPTVTAQMEVAEGHVLQMERVVTPDGALPATGK